MFVRELGSMPVRDRFVSISALVTMASALLSVIMGLRHFGPERVVFWRERRSGLSAMPYFVGKSLATFVPSVMLPPMVFLSGYYTLVRPRATLTVMYAVLCLVNFAGVGLGQLLGLLSPPQNATLNAVVFVMVMQMLSGANPTLKELATSGADVVTYVSFCRWSVQLQYALNVLPFVGLYDINPGLQFIGYPSLDDGDAITRGFFAGTSTGFRDSVYLSAAMLAFIGVAARVAALCALQFRKAGGA